ncbi:MAG: LacI family transcriptional regulator [Clostridiaceae bacterium]|nr:LacI family transcriptional regulator [Clostridiaceae bacterium]
MGKITIKDIAKQAGVSIATVSRVINRTGNVSESIKARVQAVIENNNYRPNFLAQNLKSERTYTVGLIFSDISDRYFSIMAKAIGEVLHDNNYSLILCNSNNNPENEQWYFDFLISKQVDGIILNTVGGLDQKICELSLRVPLVLVNRRVEEFPELNIQMDFIGADDRLGTALMVQHLVNNGHKRIGIINGDLTVSTGRERFEGFRMTMGENSLNIDDSYEYRFDGKFNADTGYKGMHYLMNLSSPPTAVLTMNDSITVGALKYCRQHGISIPQDLSLICYGDIDNAEILFVKPTYIALSPSTTGYRATQCILERIQNPKSVNREIIITPTLIEGDSVVRI